MIVMYHDDDDDDDENTDVSRPNRPQVSHILH